MDAAAGEKFGEVFRDRDSNHRSPPGVNTKADRGALHILIVLCREFFG
jgi:hypothetical protein